MSRNRATANLQVVQYVCEIETKADRFQVLRTGDPKFVLFRQLRPLRGPGRSWCTGIEFPVKLSTLKPGVKHAIANGMSVRMTPADAKPQTADYRVPTLQWLGKDAAVPIPVVSLQIIEHVNPREWWLTQIPALRTASASYARRLMKAYRQKLTAEPAEASHVG